MGNKREYSKVCAGLGRARLGVDWQTGQWWMERAGAGARHTHNILAPSVRAQ